mmetsp:Transcript_113198/g.320388  ORF Transcript_113198/g.320388 Transcript_113198/m.320388 type:complete len:225 (-) Transcript_113198:90-764(-)
MGVGTSSASPCGACMSLFPQLGSGLRPDPGLLEWRLENAGALRAGLSSLGIGGSGAGHCEAWHLQLPGFDGIEFALLFYPLGLGDYCGTGPAAAPPGAACALALHATGGTNDALDISVSLALWVAPDATPAAVAAGIHICGGGRAICRGAWPSCAGPSSAAVLRAKIERSSAASCDATAKRVAAAPMEKLDGTPAWRHRSSWTHPGFPRFEDMSEEIDGDCDDD